MTGFVGGSFVLLTVLTLLAPLRFALVALAVLSHLDLTGLPGGSSLNVVRILVVPGLLYLRLRRAGRPATGRERWNFKAPLVAFGIFVASLLPAEAQSQFQLAGAKLLIYLVALIILVGILTRSVQLDLLRDVRVLALLVVLPLGLAALQTYGLGNVYGTTEGRFTSFTSPQTYGQYYLGVIAFLLTQRWMRLPVRSCLVLLALAAVILSGSRSALIGVALIGLVGLFASGAIPLEFRLPVVSFLTPLLAFVLVNPAAVLGARNAQLLDSPSGLAGVGTFRYREIVLAQLADAMSRNSALDWVIGHGLGAAAFLVIPLDSRYTLAGIDINRTVHNEYWRLIYEGGLLSLLPFVAVIGLSVLACYRRGGALPATAVLMLAVLAWVENVLPSASGPAGIGIALVFASALGHAPREGEPVASGSGRRELVGAGA